MQVHLPIALCLLRDCDGGGMNLAVHQVQPENMRSIGDFVARSGGELLHHVLFFTHLSYAECQSAVRRYVAGEAGADMIGRSKAIVGDADEIARAMTRLALDSSRMDASLARGRATIVHKRQREHSPPPPPSNLDGDDDDECDSFISDEADEDEDEGEEDDDGDEDEEAGCFDEDEEDEEEEYRPAMRRFVRQDQKRVTS